VRERLREIGPTPPDGIEVVTTYDRSDRITRAIDTLKHELVLEMIVVSLVILVFLWHLPSAVVPIVTIPVAVLLAFIPMAHVGISSNIMSLAGIAISIGVLVDGAIVEVENAYKEAGALGGRRPAGGFPRRSARGPARGRRVRLLPQRLVAGVERPMGEHRTRAAEASRGRASHDRAHLLSPVHEHEVRHQGRPGAARRAFSVVGAVWLMYALGYNVSIAAWVGMIALMGL
jgi:hypothetical protein